MDALDLVIAGLLGFFAVAWILNTAMASDGSAVDFASGSAAVDNPFFFNLQDFMPSTDTNPTPQAAQIAAAIKQVETGGNYNAVGASGENGGYQFLPATWAAWAARWLGNSAAPMTPANQDLVATSQIQSWLDAGYTPQQVALLWNGGSTTAKSGINSHGVAYDSGAYANKVLSALKSLFGGTNV